MVFLKHYFRKLKEILQVQSILPFVLLFLFAIFILTLAISKFFAHEAWGVPGLISLFLMAFIFQKLFLLKKCYMLFLFRILVFFLLAVQVLWNLSGATLVPISHGVYNRLDPNSLVGAYLQPNLRNVPIVYTLNNDTICSMTLSVDSCHRRVPDDNCVEEYLMNLHHPCKHALFLGCSFTFGWGLMCSSTFPYLFETLNPDYKSYNYGVSGYGPHQLALLFDKRVDMINETSISERDGFALYTYIDDHLNRVYGGSKYLIWSYCPPNVYVENDSLIIKKWPLIRRLNARILDEIRLFRFFEITQHYPKSENFYKRFASLINYTAKKYWELKPGNHFYVGIYPGYDKDLNWIQYVDEKVVILRMNPPSDYDNKSKYEIYPPYDQHPSGAANAYYAEELTRLIKEYE